MKLPTVTEHYKGRTITIDGTTTRIEKGGVPVELHDIWVKVDGKPVMDVSGDTTLALLESAKRWIDANSA